MMTRVQKQLFFPKEKKQNFEDIFESRKFDTDISMRSHVKYEITQNRTRLLHLSSFTYHEKIKFSYLHLVRRKYKIIHDHRSIRYPNIFTMIYDAWLFTLLSRMIKTSFDCQSEYGNIKKWKKNIYIYIYLSINRRFWWISDLVFISNILNMENDASKRKRRSADSTW